MGIFDEQSVSSVRRRTELVLIAAFVLFGVSGAAQAQTLVRNCTPIKWQTDGFVDWIRDTSPKNGVDDLIDASADDQFDIVVNFNRCVEDQDMSFLANLATVQRRCKYISSVTVGAATKSVIDSIVANPNVAFVELQGSFEALLDVSVPNIQVSASATFSPNTVQDLAPNIDGSGITIAIIDTGVDNTHAGFNATTFVAGYDAITQTFGDPADDVFHGTHVASIALGQATANTSRGVAPAANLVDVKVIDANTSCSTAGAWNVIVDGLETVYDNRDTWGVDVINMSLGQCNAFGIVGSDGTDSFSQLVDLAESMNIVTVAAVGNSGPTNAVLSTPAAATRAITVAASSDEGTVTRTDDLIANYSSRGPRSNDGDADCIDELKPDVTAPGGHSALNSLCSGFDATGGIRAARFNTTNGVVRSCGTSMAAPHVAGLAALILEARPGINAASVKELILSTANPMGTASSPACDAVWNNRWGWGLVNAFNAINQATQTNMEFPSHPPATSWLSPDIRTSPYPPKKNVPNRVTVTIKNSGPNPATNVRVHTGALDFAANLPTAPFNDIGTQIVNVPAGAQRDVDFTWTPTSDGHMCLKAEIGYGADTDFSDNKAQRNVTVAASPVSFRAQNTLTTGPATITFEPTFEFIGACWGDASIGCNDDTVCPPGEHCIPQVWTAAIDPPNVTLAADDCPVDVQVDLQPPPDYMTGSRQTVHVEARIGGTLIGGVSVESNPNQTAGNLVMGIPILTGWGLALLLTLLLLTAVILLRRRSSGITG